MSMGLEAVAINYLSLHNSVRAWLIAFLTAALSFWKIKHSPIHPPPNHHHHQHLSVKSSSPSPTPPQISSADQQEEVPSTWATTFCWLENNNRRSGKFRVYYGGEDYDVTSITAQQQQEQLGKKDQIRRVVTTSVRWPVAIRLNNNNSIIDGWEALLNLKTAEMGWYRYQDLTLLDGSVVQLWNHHHN